MIKEKIKSWFQKKYFVYGNLTLEINKNIADEIQSTFDEIICIAKLKGYEIEEEHYFKHLILTIYCAKYEILCIMYIDKTEKKVKDIGISLYNKTIKYYQEEDMIESLKKLRNLVLTFEK
jgi:hypothetical protein